MLQHRQLSAFQLSPVPAITYAAAAILHVNPANHRPRSFASEASSDQTQAKPIKKGLSAGTVPPATEQVPLGSAQQKDLRPDSRDADSLKSSPVPRPAHKDSATVGEDRPSASAIPAGVDQVPPSSHSNATSQPAQGTSIPENEPSTSRSAPQQSMQSVISDISSVGKLGTASSSTSSDDSTTSGDSSQDSISRWQRFKWWIWGTPQQYWTDQSSKQEQNSQNFGAASDSDTDSADRQPVKQRSKWLLGNIFESAIMRTGVIKDEDVARYKHLAFFTFASSLPQPVHVTICD